MSRIEAAALGANELGRVVAVEMWNGEGEADTPEQLVRGVLLRVEHEIAEPTVRDDFGHVRTTGLDLWAVGQRLRLQISPGHGVDVGDEPKVWPVIERS